MTDNDFKVWVTDLSKRFPDTHVWIKSMPCEQETMRTWKQLLEDLGSRELRFFLEANRHFQSTTGFRVFEREMIPQIVAKKARELEWQFNQVAMSEEKQALLRRRPVSVMNDSQRGIHNAAVARYLEIKNSQSKAAADAWLAKERL